MNRTAFRSWTRSSWLAFLLAAGHATLAVTFTNDTLISSGTAGFDGQEIVVSNCTVTIDGSHVFADVTLLSGGVLTHSFSSSGSLPDQVSTGLRLTITNNLLIEPGGTINVSGKGYGGGYGPGAGKSATATTPYTYTAGSGGGHGGYGGFCAAGAPGGTAYDSVSAPFDKGSGGGAGSSLGAAGGGTVLLTVSNLLRIDGSILADGANATNARAGGGAGGAISIISGSIAGSGTISANGGEGEPVNGGGGGGGRIAINSVTNLFAGTLTARGAAGFRAGGAGTVFARSANLVSPVLRIDNGGLAGTNTTFTIPDPQVDCTIAGKAVARLTGSGLMRSLTVDSGSWLAAGAEPMLLTISRDLVVASGGGVTADGQGYGAGTGPGAGATGSLGTPQQITVGAGGGCAGCGGAAAAKVLGGNFYGSILQPGDRGSGGGGSNGTGGAGGGAIRLTVNGRLTLDGTISADGAGGRGPGTGGGSGGSVWLTVGALAGAGQVSASGGGGDLPFGGGGGGGRILVQVTTNLFGGTYVARGGPGVNYGGAGVVCLSPQNNETTQVFVDNGGVLGTNTSLASLSRLADATLSGGAVVDYSTLSTFRNLTVGSNCWIRPTSATQTRSLVVNGDLTLAAGGGFVFDGLGNKAGLGPGAGKMGAGGTAGSGAGFGGAGGYCQFNAAGGPSYGSITNPVDLGSGGGPGYGGTQVSSGGAGGSAVSLDIKGTLSLYGSISANGQDGLSQGAGGGSGGAILLKVGKFVGSGAITANGGAGDLPAGGGGGGGRVAVYCNTNLFTGIMAARGGAGFAAGGAGTIFIGEKLSRRSDKLVIDNGGLRGTNTPLTGLIYNEIDVLGGAIALASPYPGSTLRLTNLFVGSNSLLTFPSACATSPFILSVSSNATVEAAAAISLDGCGCGSGQGTGAGRTSATSPYGQMGGGGGYAGYGGNSYNNAAGGQAYALFGSKASPGSGGGAGGGLGDLTGGSGGGALDLTVSGTLQLDGRLSANGTTGPGWASGGGSGGGLIVQAGRLRGAGFVGADGGTADLPYGGGGGGGLITVFCGTNAFTGTMQARGGGGATYGGAGAVFVKTNRSTAARLTIDNGGNRGTNTSFAAYGSCDVTISGGAVAGFDYRPIIFLDQVVTSLRSLTIRSNAWLTVLPRGSSEVAVSGDALVEAGGGVVVDGKGYAGGVGPGAGATTSTATYGWTGGGGGGAGCGGSSVAGAVGGNAYGSFLEPRDLGSGGGGYSASTYGASGGGNIWLTIGQTLTVNGRVSADGSGAFFSGSGGGGGGSVRISANRLAGSGRISANGGMGDVPQGGGGGGGHIALLYYTNSFAGVISAWGGPGAVYGGAGTVCYRPIKGNTTLVVDNNGNPGTNTLYTPNTGIDLVVSGAATVHPATPAFTLNNLFLSTGGSMTHLENQSRLDITITGNALVESNALIVVDAKGYSGTAPGPGAGMMLSGMSGSGAGYGGAGGRSASGAPGGLPYGSAMEPTDRGSRGGIYPVLAGYSAGGGAVVLQVYGTLTLNGGITANGSDALIDSAGGGSGGSVYVTARSLAGTGFAAANGGSGDPYAGGGGGGGRVAFYSRTNLFTGMLQAKGGPGFAPGQNGSIVSTNIPPPYVVAQSPADIVSYAVSWVDLTFNAPINFATTSSADVAVDTPLGMLAPGDLFVSSGGTRVLRVSLPLQNLPGYYEIDLAPGLEDKYGVKMAQPYYGSFVILPPTISGRVADTNGLPVPYVTLLVSGQQVPAVTDASGAYSIEVAPSWVGSITPTKGAWKFVPFTRNYAGVGTTLTNQDFTMVAPSMLALRCTPGPSLMHLSWYGFSNVTYNVLYSVDLQYWYAWGENMVGANAPMAINVDTGTAPAAFFKVMGFSP